jgi:TRAP-type C4-dicarboxylate transport system permease small subunit
VCAGSPSLDRRSNRGCPIATETDSRGIERRSTGGALVIAAVGLAALVTFVFLVIADVLLRWQLAAPIDGLAEISKLLVAVVVASFFPLSLAERQHIAIDLLGSRLPAGARRLVEAFAAVVTLVVFALIAWRLGLYTDETARSGETTWILGWPVTPWWVAVASLIAFCVPIQTVVVWRHLGRRGGANDRPPRAGAG